jgi:hypothetical protein
MSVSLLSCPRRSQSFLNSCTTKSGQGTPARNYSNYASHSSLLPLLIICYCYEFYCNTLAVSTVPLCTLVVVANLLVLIVAVTSNSDAAALRFAAAGIVVVALSRLSELLLIVAAHDAALLVVAAGIVAVALRRLPALLLEIFDQLGLPVSFFLQLLDFLFLAVELNVFFRQNFLQLLDFLFLVVELNVFLLRILLGLFDLFDLFASDFFSGRNLPRLLLNLLLKTLVGGPQVSVFSLHVVVLSLHVVVLSLHVVVLSRQGVVLRLQSLLLRGGHNDDLEGNPDVLRGPFGGADEGGNRVKWNMIGRIRLVSIKIARSSHSCHYILKVVAKCEKFFQLLHQGKASVFRVSCLIIAVVFHKEP